MLNHKILLRMIKYMAVAFALSTLPTGRAEAVNSQWCRDNPSICVCDEPMNTSSYTTSDSQHFNPADTTSSDKECGDYDGVARAPLASGQGVAWTTVNSGAAIDALPSGHSQTWVLRSNTHSGAFFGHRAASGVATARRGIRYYTFRSTDFSFTSDSVGSGCNSNKTAQLGGPFIQGPMFTLEGGTWTIYDVHTSLGFNQTANCCQGPGPGNHANGPSLSSLKGKWVRHEIYVNNAATTGVGTTYEAWVTNITDGGPALNYLDTSQTRTGVDNEWTSSLATNLHRTSPQDTMAINFFRSNNGQACTGYAAYAGFTYAAWPTAAGQRIGAATEIEGGGTPAPDTTPPAAPTGISIVKR